MRPRHLLVLALLMGGVELPPSPARRPPDEPEPDDDTDDEGLDDDTVTTYRKPTGEGVSLMVTYDPSADDFTLDGVSTDDEETSA